MPLEKSASRAAVGRNIETEMAHGKSRRVALAIALDVQRRAAQHTANPHRKKLLRKKAGQGGNE